MHRRRCRAGGLIAPILGLDRDEDKEKLKQTLRLLIKGKTLKQVNRPRKIEICHHALSRSIGLSREPNTGGKANEVAILNECSTQT